MLLMVFRRLIGSLLGNETATGALRRLHDSYARLWSSFTHRFPIGANVYEKDWDLLILLDCCRIDAIEAVADEYEFITDVDSMISVGSTSREWMAKTFTNDYLDEISETSYITSNGYPQTIFEWGRYEYPHKDGEDDYRRAHMENVGFDVVNHSDFELLDQVWKYTPDEMMRDDKVLPRFLTDRAISVARNQDPDRLIVHYMYPHGPYIANAGQNERNLEEFERQPMMALRSGTANYETVWEAYLDELRFVLNDIELLLENVDAETAVLSADHGEGFGEWGMYAHLFGSPSPHVKRVPWVETTAVDSGECQPSVSSLDSTSRDLNEHLKALGYR